MTLKSTFLPVLLLMIGLLLLGCSQAPDLDQPPEIRYGEDICDECNMIISEPRFAAAYYTVDGESRLFDDVGDMFAYHIKHHEDVARFWVHDYHTEEWLRAESAFFVLSAEVYTPMSLGVVAFSEQSVAATFADEVNGMVMSFDDLMNHYEPGGTAGEHSHDDGAGMNMEESVDP